MANSIDPDQLASEDANIWIYTVCKGRVYPGSAGQGLMWNHRVAHPSALISCHAALNSGNLPLVPHFALFAFSNPPFFSLLSQGRPFSQ